MPALFSLLADNRAQPSELARGPWTPNALHGGPVAALFARAIEHHESNGVEWFVSRLTVELERPVPVEPLTWFTDTTRDGRKVSVIDATLIAGGRTVARARALRIRAAEVDVPLPSSAEGSPPPVPTTGGSLSSRATYAGFHNAGTEHRFASGGFDTPGPVFDWIRLQCPVVEGEEPSPLERVAAAADFANGVSRILDFETHLFINPDLTIHLFRPLEGEWVGMEATTFHGPEGVGLSDTAVYDSRGRIGRTNQSLLLEAR